MNLTGDSIIPTTTTTVLMSDDVFQRVLSIQSHVVSGYVGNRAAVFPLQLLGYEVDFVNSVQFSNHTGYEVVTGKNQVLNSSELEDLLNGLSVNNLNRYSHVLTGYVGSESFLKQIAVEVTQLKSVNPSLVYLCDPVLGDNDVFYVPDCLVQVYKSTILPLADIITPNDFELRQLTGLECDSAGSIIEAIDMLHGMGPRIVVMTSTLLDSQSNQLTLVCSQKPTMKRYSIKFPKLPGYFTGTGDLFSAVFLAWSAKYPTDLKLACEMSLSTVYRLLQNTSQYHDSKQANENTTGVTANGNSKKSPPPDLRIIASKADIENPPILFHASEM